MKAFIKRKFKQMLVFDSSYEVHCQLDI